MPNDDSGAEVLEFWFTEASPKQWFTKDADFDTQIHDRFGNIVEAALAGTLINWEETSSGLLAKIIVLDQFTRNIFRKSPQAFAGDEKALALSLAGQDQGLLEEFDQNQRHFLLVPMMHSEDVEIQDASLPLFKKYTNENTFGFAVKHRDIIARFGRFPHRNEDLSRESTDEEVEFLSKPGASF